MAGAMTIAQAIDFTKRMSSGVSYRRPLKVCQHIMLSGVLKCFSQSADPNGRPWKPLKIGRKRGVRASARILRDTGALLASGAANSARGAVRKLTDKVAVIGSNLIYAAIHHYGGKIKVTPRMRAYLHYIGIHLKASTKTITIPARPFIGHRRENFLSYEKVFAEFEEERAKK